MLQNAAPRILSAFETLLFGSGQPDQSMIEAVFGAFFFTLYPAGPGTDRGRQAPDFYGPLHKAKLLTTCH